MKNYDDYQILSIEERGKFREKRAIKDLQEELKQDKADSEKIKKSYEGVTLNMKEKKKGNRDVGNEDKMDESKDICTTDSRSKHGILNICCSLTVVRFRYRLSDCSANKLRSKSLH